MTQRLILSSCLIFAQVFHLVNSQLVLEKDCICVPARLCRDSVETNDSKPKDFEQSFVAEGDSAFRSIVLRYRCADKREICCAESSIIHLYGKCGTPNPKGMNFLKKRDGARARILEFPWIVLVAALRRNEETDRMRYEHRCSGSLIHPFAVLTVAHRIFRERPENLRVDVGQWDHKVRQVIIHEAFDEENRFNDYAIVILSEPAEPAPNIGLVCPAKENAELDFSRCIVSAWPINLTSGKLVNPTTIGKLKVSIIPDADCHPAFDYFGAIRDFDLHPSFVCTAKNKRGNICQGDFGSPLVCPYLHEPSRYSLVAMSSGWRKKCNEPGIPGVFTRVDIAREWIDAKIIENDFRPSDAFLSS